MILMSSGRLRLVAAMLAIGLTALAGAACESHAPTSPSPPPAAPDLTGTWTGSAADSSGPGTMTWRITQTATSLTGTVAMTDSATNAGGRGSISASVSGTSIHFSISVPAGGFDSPFGSCTASVSGDAQASSSSITGTYSGVNSCTGAITAGQVTLARTG
jgi:hypothetical protein